MAVFTIDSTDYSDCIKIDGLKWKRTDLESEGAGRTMDGVMHRSRIAQKRTLTVRCRRLSQSRLAELTAALQPETVQVQHSDPVSGSYTGTYYGTELEAATAITQGGTLYWDDAAFTLVEV